MRILIPTGLVTAGFGFDDCSNRHDALYGTVRCCQRRQRTVGERNLKEQHSLVVLKRCFLRDKPGGEQNASLLRPRMTAVSERFLKPTQSQESEQPKANNSNGPLSNQNLHIAFCCGCKFFAMRHNDRSNQKQNTQCDQPKALHEG